MQVQNKREKKLLRAAEIKDNIVETVMAEGGPCKHETDVTERMSALDPQHQRGFLLNQLIYYKTLHQFPGLDKSLFHQQTKGKKLSVENLQKNLVKVLHHRDTLSSTSPIIDHMQQNTQDNKTEQLHQLKRKYLDIATNNAEKAKYSKRKKSAAFPSEIIIGKRIRHLWKLNGKEIWCKGRVLRKSTEEDMDNVDDEDEKHIGLETFYTVRYDMWKSHNYVYPLQKEWEDGCVQLLA